jgi:hypothetical protein
LGETPECIGGEADRKEDQQKPPERVLRERPERALAACRLAATLYRKLDREHPDQGKRRAFGDEADPRERVQPVGVLDLVSGSIEVCGGSHVPFISTEPGFQPVAYEKSVIRIDRPLAAAVSLSSLALRDFPEIMPALVVCLSRTLSSREVCRARYVSSSRVACSS